ncbi:MAG: hypothetical protein MK212_08535 [Saprospiraceae bacterium]|nr:hypothetical protein [Saprospiraceae bacterium]
MDRSKLLEVPSYDASKYDVIDQLISTIEDKLDYNEDISDEIAQVHLVANKVNQFDEDTFKNYWSAVSKEEIIEEILTPNPPRIENITQEEILQVLEKMTKLDIAHSDYYLELLCKNCAYPHSISDLIYWPNELGYTSDPSLEEKARILYNNEIAPSKTP